MTILDLSKKLKYCRGKKKLTQSQVAELLNVSRKTISSWENERSFPDITSLVKLSRIYDISLDDLLQDDHLIENYDTQERKLQNSYTISKITYYLNIILCLLNYFEFSNFRPPHIPVLYILLISNLIIYLTHFSNWDKFKNHLLFFKGLLLFLLLFICNTFLNIFLISSSEYLVHADPYFIFGFSLGRLIFIFGVTFSLEIILLFRQNKK